MPVQIRMGAALIEGTTLNLSDHGMYMFTAANLPAGGDIEIVFRPPGEKQLVHASAVIRRKVVYLYGIEFLEKVTHPAEDRQLRAIPDGSSSSCSSDAVDETS